MELLKRKEWDILGHAFFVSIIILSVVFYKERIYYFDSAFQFFKIIHFEKFNIEAHRYSTVLTQFFVLLAIKLSMPLKAVTIIFSVSFPLLYYAVYLTCVKILKSPEAGLLVILSLILGVKQSFFYTVTETFQAVVYSALFFGYINYWFKQPRGKEFMFWAIALIILALCYFSHPISLFPVFYILGFYLIDTRDWKNYRIYLLVAIIAISYLLKVLVTDSNSYEGALFSQLGNTMGVLSNIWEMYTVSFFVSQIFGLYLTMVLISGVVVVYYWLKKEWFKLAYFTTAGSLFFIVIVIVYNQGSASIAMERCYIPLSIFIGVPFTKEVLNKQNRLFMVKYIAVVFIVLYGFTYIYKAGQTYKKRSNYVAALVAHKSNLPENKFIVQRSQLNMKTIEVPWALACETLMYSSLNSNTESSSFYLLENITDTAKMEISRTNRLFLVNFWLNWNSSELNTDYFNLPEGNYKILHEDLKNIR